MRPGDATLVTAKLASLRAVICAGAPVPPALIRRYMDKGIVVQQAWGLRRRLPLPRICRLQ
ncbi:hypothetical protein [Corynebacterium belfantii]|uniref:hypothetical protein n=1 Tax=Corynebacterium belfantii TaxID=2014537 RepID=UPI00248B04B1|nr:hypothetical protein [Corynebacterium belfantii]